jgi:hypothetical protein
MRAFNSLSTVPLGSPYASFANPGKDRDLLRGWHLIAKQVTASRVDGKQSLQSTLKPLYVFLKAISTADFNTAIVAGKNPLLSQYREQFESSGVARTRGMVGWPVFNLAQRSQERWWLGPTVHDPHFGITARATQWFRGWTHKFSNFRSHFTGGISTLISKLFGKRIMWEYDERRRECGFALDHHCTDYMRCGAIRSGSLPQVFWTGRQ